MKRIVYFVIFLTLLNYYSYSQNVSFNASVSRNEVQVGERIQITFTLNNAQGTDFKPPKFVGFSVLQGPMTRQSTQIINGNYSFSVSYTFLLQADLEGKHTIESATINAQGKKLNSNPVTITVTKGQPKAKNDNPQEQNFNKQAEELVKKNIFIRVSSSKQSVYQGEQLVVTYKLYVSADLYQGTNLSPKKMPILNGFWSNDLIELNAQNQNVTRENIDGKTFIVREIKKTLLVPLESGNLNIDALELDAKVAFAIPKQKKSRNPFDDFFDDPFFNPREVREYNTEIKSKPITINVKPLPDNKPIDFNGAVGELQMKASLDKSQTTQNQPITLKVTISGNGNLKLLQPFQIKLPPDIEMYEPKTNDNIQFSANGMTGNRQFEFLLLPRNPGEYKLEPIRFVYFDLNSKTYKTITSEEFLIKVDKGSGEQVANITGVNKQDIKYLGKDIRYIKNDMGAIINPNYKFFGSIFYVLLIILPLGLGFFAIIYRKKLDELYGNKALLLNKKASKTALKRLSLAKKYLNENKEENFYEETSKALWNYLSHKLNIPIAELSKDTIENNLKKREIEVLIINKLMETIDYCEFARFAPNAEKIGMKEVFDDAANVITELERKIK